MSLLLLTVVSCLQSLKNYVGGNGIVAFSIFDNCLDLEL